MKIPRSTSGAIKSKYEILGMVIFPSRRRPCSIRTVTTNARTG